MSPMLSASRQQHLNGTDASSQSPFDRLATSCDICSGPYWSARALMHPMGYHDWSGFKDAVLRALAHSNNLGLDPDTHFAEARDGIHDDFRLSAMGAHLLVFQCNPSLPEVKDAALYFSQRVATDFFAEKPEPFAPFDVDGHLIAKVKEIVLDVLRRRLQFEPQQQQQRQPARTQSISQSLRGEIAEHVRRYVEASGSSYHDAWGRIRRAFEQRFHCRLSSRRRDGVEGIMKFAQSMNRLPQLLDIARDILPVVV